ncbi:helix-turn-helix domain-containing protein [Azospirillum sp. SYSU D00513]|uniref:helix-turn-helix domain-containing protein n=1 Tax=Azospirillum sp. SYSU D00513 TaxID=2812561 RepID=UPI001A96798D|nr:helix-turn-helix domain-containing protein [Azospirillum sp. SYSU D00513]
MPAERVLTGQAMQSPSSRLLSALLEAERALGRLAEAMQDPVRRGRLWADAARRDACAAARLDGVAVDPTDFLIATVSPDLVPHAGRGTAQSVRSLWQGALFTQGRLAAPARRMSRPSPPRSGGAAADAWRAVAELEADMADLSRFDREEDTFDGVPSEGMDAEAPAPWSLGWLESLWRCLQAEISGRDPGRLVFSAERETEASALLARIEAAGEEPAMLGAVGMLAGLLRPAPDLRTPGWAVAPARLMAALAVGRNCRASNVWLPMAAALQTDRTTAQIAARGRDEDWRVWLAEMVAEAARRERQRAAALDQAAETWRRRVGLRRRNSRLPEVMDGLFEEPAFTVRHIQKRLGTTFRGAQLLVDELEEAAIVREVTNRALDRVFVAVDLMP